MRYKCVVLFLLSLVFMPQLAQASGAVNAYKNAQQQPRQRGVQQPPGQRGVQQPQTQQQAAYQQSMEERSKKYAYVKAKLRNVTLEQDAPLPYRSSYKRLDRFDVSEVVDISEIVGQLENSSRVWLRLMDDEPNSTIVLLYLDHYRDQGVRISRSPIHYVEVIDLIVESTPEILNKPFKDLIRFVAVMEYDFDMGIDKDMLALQVLGDVLYRQNRQRIGF